MTLQASEPDPLLAVKGSAHPATLPDWDDALSDVPAAGRTGLVPVSASPHPVAVADTGSSSVASAGSSSVQAAPLLPSHILRSKRAESQADKERAEPPGSPDPMDEPEEELIVAGSPGDSDQPPEVGIADDEAGEVTSAPSAGDDAGSLAPVGDALSGAPEDSESGADQALAQPLAPVEALEPEPGDGLGRDSDPPAAPVPAADPDPGLAKLSAPGETRPEETGDLKAPLGSPGTPSLARVVPGAVPGGRPVERKLGVAGSPAFTEPGKGTGKRDLWVIVALVLLGMAAVSLIAWSIHGNLLMDQPSQALGEGRLGSATPSAEPAAAAPPERSTAAAPPESSTAAELAVGAGDYLPSESPLLGTKLDTAARSKQPLAKAGTKAAVEPKVDLVRIETTGEAIIAGVAAPHSELVVLDKGQPIGTVTVDSRGEWVLLPATPLAKGDHEISLVMKIVSDSVKLPRLD